MRVVKELVGKEVLSGNVERMGKVVDVDIDPIDETIEAIIVSKSGLQETLNISKSELVVPFDMVSKIGDKVILEDAFNDDLDNLDKEIQELRNRL